GIVATGAGSSVYIYNNVIIQGGADVSWNYCLYQLSASSYFYNNTVYNTKGSYTFHLYTYIEGAYTYKPETVEIKNNIFYNQAACDYFLIENESQMGSVSISNNCYYGNGNGPTRDTAAVNANPLFYDAASGDFHLLVNSPAKDVGANVSSIVTKDYDGLLRPQGSGFDMGAYEYASGYTGGGGDDTDVTPPAAITDLASVLGTNSGEIILSWTAPFAGDGSKVSGYEIKYSTSIIFEVNQLNIAADNQIEWSSAMDYPALITPASPGERQIYSCTGLDPNLDYYFAMKSYDAQGYTSAISNVSQSLAGDIDHAAPARVEDLAVETGSIEGEVILTWTAPGDDGNSGNAATYSIKYSTSAITDDNWDQANSLTDTPIPQTAGTREVFTVRNLPSKTIYFFALKIADASGNISAISNCAEGLSDTLYNLDKVRSFPNPWKKSKGGLITISHLTHNAKVKIFNLASELIRELGEQDGVVTWDAKNENGQDVGSGVYIYYAWDDEGHEKTGKIVIIK
ncbi:MAG: DUF5123 domain-containing protein, partial [bacterium]|nr:DUF5123 domain-containing protein [bacterium]